MHKSSLQPSPSASFKHKSQSSPQSRKNCKLKTTSKQSIHTFKSSLQSRHTSSIPPSNLITTTSRNITSISTTSRSRKPNLISSQPFHPPTPFSTSKRHWGWATDHKWPVKWPKNKVKEVYAGWKPPEFSKENCFFRVAKNGREIGVIEFRLFDSLVPKTAHNFRQLCLGTRKVLNMPLHYRGTRFHRVIKRFMIQGGDITNNDGTGGASIYGRHFPDESFLLTHDRPFLLASANRGPNTNNSGFYITTNPAPWLDGRNVIFGEVVYGQDVVREIEFSQTNPMDTPMEHISIVDCGVVNTNV